MNALENNILELLRQGCIISDIEKNLNIKEEDLADIIIGLDEKGLIILQDKNWILTDKGKEIFVKREEELKKLKIDYLRGEINKDEFDRRKRELSDIIEKSDDDSRKDSRNFFYPSSKKDDIVTQDIIPKDEPRKDDDKDKGKEEPVELKKLICPKCSTENRPESNFCRKCGTAVKKV